jgi:glucuronate isomerase
LAELDKERDWVMQFHYGPVRNVNTPLFEKFGADRGGDVSTHLIEVANNVSPLLSKFSGKGDGTDLRVVLYPIDANLYEPQSTVIRAFPGAYWGIAWWQNDAKKIMERQIALHAETNYLRKCGGMLCDGRKLTSLRPRFDVYFRAVANQLAEFVEEGMISEAHASSLARAMAYDTQASLYKINRVVEKVRQAA